MSKASRPGRLGRVPQPSSTSSPEEDPPTTTDDFNALAWRDFIVWAWNEPEMRAQFTAKTGVEVSAGRALIDAAIDAATGARRSVVVQFVEWATREHWGVEQTPAAYRAVLESGTRES